MRLSIIQHNIVWEKKHENLRSLGEVISSVYGNTDIVVLPEMFSTGFTMNPADISEAPYAETYDWMLDISVKGNVGLCGSYIVKQDRSFFNRWVFVSPERKSWHYDKRHLFSITNEDKNYTRGNNRVVFSFRGVRICPNICYDLRFPVWSRNRQDYDLLINSANWPESRKDVWITLLKARAIENQCYVAGVNRTGWDGEGIKYSGNSMIIGPKGNIITEIDDNKEELVTAEISLSVLNDFRDKFPVHKDADNFTISI
ncbi:MAG TPA: amidohydrolase [Bacteroidales bacterium]|nr:amidohydrolase [Bacteroidales bacterium]